MKSRKISGGVKRVSDTAIQNWSARNSEDVRPTPPKSSDVLPDIKTFRFLQLFYVPISLYTVKLEL